MDAESQNHLIVDQFTRMAEPFARMPAHSAEESLRIIVEAAGIGPDDTVVDVACGPGILACEFAKTARHVTGIDLTPAMIAQARALQSRKGLTNLDWQVGDVASLPFADGTFTVAFTRYSFHHLLDPARVLGEMVRVTRPGGRVVVVDVYTSSPEQAAAYDHVERLRDPSHVRALGRDELTGLFRDAGLAHVATTAYGLEVGLEEILAASFTEPTAADAIRRIVADDIGTDRLGIAARRDGDSVRFTFPTVVVVGRRDA
jgi:ubiquinone/menaquinone biosynthesis C-methylase UbiE